MPEEAIEPFSIGESCIDKIVCEISIEDENWRRKLLEPKIFCEKIILHSIKGFEGLNGEIDILLCNDAKMRELNNIWRKIDKPTNVLSFPQIGNPNIIGSIALGFETIETEAEVQAKTFENHVAHLLVHGVLHLLGYDHIIDQEADEMEALEIEILSQIGIKDPYQDDFFIGHIS